MLERLELINKRYQEIQNLLTDPSILADINKSKELSKELASIEDIIEVYKKYKRILNDLESAH